MTTTWPGNDASSICSEEEEDNYSLISHLDANGSILSQEDLDQASRHMDDDNNASLNDSTGELRNMVPTGVIGAEHRERQRQHDDAKPFSFTNLRKLHVRESEQALNVMCVGEAGMEVEAAAQEAPLHLGAGGGRRAAGGGRRAAGSRQQAAGSRQRW